MTFNEQILTIITAIVALQLCRWVAFVAFPAHKPIPDLFIILAKPCRLRCLGCLWCIVIKMQTFLGNITPCQRFWQVWRWWCYIGRLKICSSPLGWGRYCTWCWCKRCLWWCDLSITKPQIKGLFL